MSYLPSFDLTQSRRELITYMAEDFILPTKRRNGEDLWIYHGASLRVAVAILNDRQVVITSNDNFAVMGKGWYFFDNLSFAISHGSPGMILAARVRDNAVILDWSRAQRLLYFKKILLEYDEVDSPSPQRSFDKLAKLGVDLIRWGADNTELIVLNLSAIELPDSVTELAEHYKSINGPDALIERLLSANLHPVKLSTCSRQLIKSPRKRGR